MTEMIHEFKKSEKVGNRGEEAMLTYLKGMAGVDRVVDVRTDPHYRTIDVDFLAIMDGKVCKVEVKTDTYKSGNFFYETLSAMETNSLGCFEKTEADVLLYYFINQDRVYRFNMRAFRNWFHTMRPDFDAKGYRKTLKNQRYHAGTYTSEGYAFPVATIENLHPTWMKSEAFRPELAQTA